MTEWVIEARGLTKRYGKKLAVDGIDLHVRAGEIFGLLGPNGAGKTTTILMLLGLTECSAGEVRYAARTRCAIRWRSSARWATCRIRLASTTI
jgi:ABC-2 type transport system ATP-binding protein